jgi:mRNA interferase MazF
VSLRTVNDELGVSRNLLYQRFGSKAELWRAATRPYLARIATVEGAAPTDRMEYLYRNYIRPIQMRFAPVFEQLREQGRIKNIPRIRISGGDGRLSGLDHDSDVMIDKLTTVSRSNVHARVGRLTAEQIVEIERAMMAFLGLAR